MMRDVTLFTHTHTHIHIYIYVYIHTICTRLWWKMWDIDAGCKTILTHTHIYICIYTYHLYKTLMKNVRLFKNVTLFSHTHTFICVYIHTICIRLSWKMWEYDAGCNTILSHTHTHIYIYMFIYMPFVQDFE